MAKVRRRAISRLISALGTSDMGTPMETGRPELRQNAANRHWPRIRAVGLKTGNAGRETRPAFPVAF
ncbi:hypothetical protein GCM10007872_04870 [Gluconobacter sphaericus NBRC 12467]|uniref:Uncharacterized protein n=1 Tax=Gluconobacter sphaericus NBRC 12467 TaxID=1307951 RepID=A0AA37SHF4_9PROT|nr:hypothetical protein GSP01_02510 [Gluconobacter sphaericus NBRC 12467]GLQ83579.1 hypothetical protein GCM10007872_04870 [Gluconobacter sphaericus NBRC 12467]